MSESHSGSTQYAAKGNTKRSIALLRQLVTSPKRSHVAIVYSATFPTSKSARNFIPSDRCQVRTFPLPYIPPNSIPTEVSSTKPQTTGYRTDVAKAHSSHRKQRILRLTRYTLEHNDPALLTCDRNLLIGKNPSLVPRTILHCNPLILGCHVKRAGTTIQDTLQQHLKSPFIAVICHNHEDVFTIINE
jgi:hypothetical protein